LEVFGFLAGALLAKLFGVAGIIGFAIGLFVRNWQMAIFFGFLAGIADHVILSEINPLLSTDSKALITSLVMAIVVGGALSFLGWKVRRRIKNA